MKRSQRRPKGEGSITKLPNGNLKMTITIGVGVDGKQKRKSVSAPTKAELMKRVTELRISVGQKTQKPVYFKELLELYMKDKEPTMSYNTHRRYLSLSRTVYKPLYDYKVDKITPEVLDALLDALSKDKKESTIIGYKKALSCVFNYAVRHKLLSCSPVLDTRKRDRGSWKAETTKLPTEKEMQEMLKEAKAVKTTLPFYALCLLAVSTGARLGELLGLTYEDIDLEANIIDINKQATLEGTHCALKTKSSYRRIYVSHEVLVAVMKETEAVPHKRIFRQVCYKTAVDYVSKYLKSLPHTPEGFTFHSFRHFHATQLLKKGIDVKAVSKRLGHKDIATTLNLYAHWIPESDQRASLLLGTQFIF